MKALPATKSQRRLQVEVAGDLSGREALDKPIGPVLLSPNSASGMPNAGRVVVVTPLYFTLLYSIILLKLSDAMVNITTSKITITRMSIGRLARSPVTMRLLVASTT